MLTRVTRQTRVTSQMKVVRKGAEKWGFGGWEDCCHRTPQSPLFVRNGLGVRRFRNPQLGGQILKLLRCLTVSGVMGVMGVTNVQVVCQRKGVPNTNGWEFWGLR